MHKCTIATVTVHICTVIVAWTFNILTIYSLSSLCLTLTSLSFPHFIREPLRTTLSFSHLINLSSSSFPWLPPLSITIATALSFVSRCFRVEWGWSLGFLLRKVTLLVLDKASQWTTCAWRTKSVKPIWKRSVSVELKRVKGLCKFGFGCEGKTRWMSGVCFSGFLVELKAAVGVGWWVVWILVWSTCALGFFYWFFFLDAGVDLVAQWEVGDVDLDNGGCLMMVAVWVVLDLWERWQW